MQEERLPTIHPRADECDADKFGAISLLVFDFDGVMTDNAVYVFEDGREAVRCHRGDGLGITMLHQLGLPMLVLSTERNPVVQARCTKLRLECHQGIAVKIRALESIVSERGLLPEHVAYMGNDLNDLECLQWVGLPIAVADSVQEVLAAAKYVTRAPGGHGAVREVADLIRAAGWGGARGKDSVKSGHGA